MTAKVAVAPIPTPPAAIARAALARLTFADGYRAQVTHTQLPPPSAHSVAQAMFGEPPKVVQWLMSLRNGIVGLFGLQAAAQRSTATQTHYAGSFPVVFETSEEILLGFNDRHLDFRIWLSVSPKSDGFQVEISTLVQEHNAFGKVYLWVVMPVHRVLSRWMLARGLRHLTAI